MDLKKLFLDKREAEMIKMDSHIVKGIEVTARKIQKSCEMLVEKEQKLFR